jgi:X-Pro dipeptidyl-peptidase C-terminal non-catalytic domain
VVKLGDVGRDGSSTLITTGWLRASHRTSHEQPEQLSPLRVHEFRVPIWATAYEIAEGHRLRLAFSCSDFPRIWPTTQNPTVHVHAGGEQASRLRISTAALHRAAGIPPSPGTAPSLAWVRDGAADWVIHRNVGRNEITVELSSRAVATTPGGDRVETESDSTAIVAASHPEGARSASVARVRLALPSGGEALIEARSHVTQYGLMVSGRVERDGKLIFERRWLK